jgi:hypothetical protein
MELLDVLQPGDAIVSKDAGAATAVIRFFTQSQFTHVDGYVGHILGEPILVGAGPVFGGVFSKVRLVPLSSLANDFVIMRPRDGSSEERLTIAKFMLSQVNLPYGYCQYIPIAYRIALRWLNRRLGTKFNVPTKDVAPGEWVCSELYAAGCDLMLRNRGSESSNYFGTPPINVYPCHIAADTMRMRLVAERVGKDLNILPE